MVGQPGKLAARFNARTHDRDHHRHGLRRWDLSVRSLGCDGHQKPGDGFGRIHDRYPEHFEFVSACRVGTTSTAYSVTFNASDGPGGTASWSIIPCVPTRCKPPGLTPSMETFLSGNHRRPQRGRSISLSMSTVGGLSVSKPFVLTIGSSLTITNPPTLPAGDVGVAYGYSLAAVGGPSPFFWSVSQGSPRTWIDGVFTRSD